MRYVRHGMSGVCGVYLITNKINGKRYVGSSNNVGSRVNQHFGTAMRKYKDIHPMYKEFFEFGRDNFYVTLLEKCTKDVKLERERYWFDTLSPEYNLIPPDAHPLLNEFVQQKSRQACSTPEYRKVFLETHRSESCRAKCRETVRHKMISCRGKNINEVTPAFESICEAARWLNRNASLCSVVSNIKESIASESRTAYGYKWEVIPNEDNT